MGTLKMMAIISDADDCGMMCICHACGCLHIIPWDTQEYLSYLKDGPVVGKYDGWDDIWDFLCGRCWSTLNIRFGADYINALARDGELDTLENLAREAFTA